MPGKFYFVATPIGNLKDITLRAIETLNMVDLILCEDTRDSQKLLNHYDIKKPLKSFHKFNYKTAIPEILDLLNEGKNIALITDAGTPCISDPGSEIISYLNNENIYYTIIPGACAFVNAFALSGFTAPLTFVGFLPENNKQEKKLLEQLKTYQTTLLFYCAPHKLLQNIKTLYSVFGERNCCTVRELTKLHEQIEYFTLSNGYPKEPKGEYVLIVEGASKQDNALNELSVLEHFDYYIKLGLSKNDAIKQVAKDRDVAKNIIYKQVVEK